MNFNLRQNWSASLSHRLVSHNGKNANAKLYFHVQILNGQFDWAIKDKLIKAVGSTSPGRLGEQSNFLICGGNHSLSTLSGYA